MTSSRATAERVTTAVVIGGASGIGAAVVADLRASGRSVLVWDVAGSYDVACDVADPGSVDGAMAQTRDRIGVPAEVTITAGVDYSALLADESVDDWDRVMAVNTRGPWLVMRTMARAMIEASVAGSMVGAIRTMHEADWVTGQILDCDGGLGLHSPIDAFGESQRAAATYVREEESSDA